MTDPLLDGAEAAADALPRRRFVLAGMPCMSRLVVTRAEDGSLEARVAY